MAAHTCEDLLLLRIGGVHVAISSRSSEAIIDPPQGLTPVSGTTPGLVAYGGHAFALVDLRARFGLVAVTPGRIVLSQAGGQRRGFVVDEVLGSVPQEGVEPAPLPPAVPRRFFSSALLVRDRTVLRTDLERLLALEPGDDFKRLAGSADSEAWAPVPPGGTVQSHVPLEEALSRVTAELRGKGRAGDRVPVHPEREEESKPQTQQEPARPAPAGTIPADHPQGSGTSFGRAKPFETGTPRPPPSSAEPPSSSAPPRVIYPAAAEEEEAPGAALLARARSWGLMLAVAAGVAVLTLGIRHHHAPGPSPKAERKAGVPAKAPLASPSSAEKKTQTSTSVDVVVGTKGGRANRMIIHVVKRGETLWAIASRYTHDPFAYRELAEQNGITDADTIKPGDQVRIILRGTP